MKDSSLGSFLQQLRKENQLTQKELASQLHGHRQGGEQVGAGPERPGHLPLDPTGTDFRGLYHRAPPGPGGGRSHPKRRLKAAWRKHSATPTDRSGTACGGSGPTPCFSSPPCVCWAAGICLLCDFCLSGRLSWSLIVLLSLALAWVVTVPLFQAKVHRVRACFLALSLALIPYLLGLWTLLPLPLPFTLATAAVSLAGLWAAYGVCRKLRHRPWRPLSRSPAHHSRKFPHRLPVSRPAVPACPGLSHPGGRVLRPDHPPFGAGLPWH